MSSTSHMLFDLLVVFVAAKALGELFERLHQPAVVGELIAGIVIGPSLLGWVTESTTLVTVATMGVVVLRFVVGLETKPSDLFRVGARAVVVAGLGVSLSLALGYWFAVRVGYPPIAALFIGTALVSTSVGVTARVLKDRGLMRLKVSHVVLAAAVIDDVLGLLVLAVVVGAASGHPDPVRTAILLGEVLLFLAFELWIAPGLVKRHVHLLDGLRIPNGPFVVALAVMLLMAAVSEQIGLAAVVGAFLAGMAFAETEECGRIERDARPLYDWLVPYFFALTGMRVQLSLFSDPRVLLLGIGLTAVAFGSKIVGCGLGAAGLGVRRMLAAGVGMIPRAEVSLIVASVGFAMRVLDGRAYAMIVFVVIASNVLVPPLLPMVFRGHSPAGSPSTT